MSYDLNLRRVIYFLYDYEHYILIFNSCYILYFQVKVHRLLESNVNQPPFLICFVYVQFNNFVRCVKFEEHLYHVMKCYQSSNNNKHLITIICFIHFVHSAHPVTPSPISISLPELTLGLTLVLLDMTVTKDSHNF